MDTHRLATNTDSLFSLLDVVFRINDLIGSGEAINEELEQSL